MEISSHTLPHGYRWLCVFDPTGEYEGAIFRSIDLTTDEPGENGWPDGITFQHIEKPIRKIYRNGKIVIQTLPILVG
jgi:hypothetical protein